MDRGREGGREQTGWSVTLVVIKDKDYSLWVRAFRHPVEALENQNWHLYKGNKQTQEHVRKQHFVQRGVNINVSTGRWMTCDHLHRMLPFWAGDVICNQLGGSAAVAPAHATVCPMTCRVHMFSHGSMPSFRKYLKWQKPSLESFTVQELLVFDVFWVPPVIIRGRDSFLYCSLPPEGARPLPGSETGCTSPIRPLHNKQHVRWKILQHII